MAEKNENLLSASQKAYRSQKEKKYVLSWNNHAGMSPGLCISRGWNLLHFLRPSPFGFRESRTFEKGWPLMMAHSSYSCPVQGQSPQQ
ncbi:hypothetical protein EMPG_12790 [Blastomyces silverae]|uniref:Uncharacterized protein n=1 Tax=Blastomyces silverae TaxID=2060906 RepID=A0A0H1BM17_9EURO|nr:hypothetical protein EMPG_12790 [Blastomyces silverae]